MATGIITQTHLEMGHVTPGGKIRHAFSLLARMVQFSHEQMTCEVLCNRKSRGKLLQLIPCCFLLKVATAKVIVVFYLGKKRHRTAMNAGADESPHYTAQ